MKHASTRTKNQVGHEAGTGERTQSVLLGSVGPGVVRTFLSASAGARQRVLGSLRYWIHFGSSPRTDDTVANSDGRSLQRACELAGSGRRREHGNGASIQAGCSACDHGRRGAAAVHDGLAQASCVDRGRNASRKPSSQAMGSVNRRQSLSPTGQQRPTDQRQRLQSRCNGAAGPALWLQAVIALLSRYCMPRGHAAGQTRRFIGLASRAGSAGSQVYSNYGAVLSQATIGSALFASNGAWVEISGRHMECACYEVPATKSRTRSVDASRGSVRRRAVILNRLTIDSDPP
jgi:hypothetical protein